MLARFKSLFDGPPPTGDVHERAQRDTPWREGDAVGAVARDQMLAHEQGVLAVGAMAAFLARLGDARGAIDQLEPPAGLLGRIHPLVDASAPVSTLPALQKGALVLMTTKKVLTLVAVALLLGGISWQVLKPPPSRTSSPPGDRQPARPGHPPAPPVAAEVTPASPSAGQPQPDAVQTATLTGRNWFSAP